MKKLLALTPILAWLLVPAVSPGVSAVASETSSAANHEAISVSTRPSENQEPSY